MKTGIHVDGKATSVARAGLTAMQAMGMQRGEWGVRAMKTNQPISELLV